MKKAFDSFCIRVHSRIQNFIRNEKGDTNFISILVVLAVAMALAAAFLGFKDQIIGWVERTMPSFFSE